MSFKESLIGKGLKALRDYAPGVNRIVEVDPGVYAIRTRNPFKYQDINAGYLQYSWEKDDKWYKDCLTTDRGRLERLLG